MKLIHSPVADPEDIVATPGCNLFESPLFVLLATGSDDGEGDLLLDLYLAGLRLLGKCKLIFGVFFIVWKKQKKKLYRIQTA